MSAKKRFLEEHNRLSPPHLQVTMATLSRFRKERPELFKDNDWSIEKLRRPFLIWLTSLPEEERKKKK